MLSLIFDVETTGLPTIRNGFYKNLNVYDSARIVSIAWRLLDTDSENESSINYFIVKPDNFIIPQKAINIHGISNELAINEGILLYDIIMKLHEDLHKCETIVAHNIAFDINVLKSELFRINFIGLIELINDKRLFCTMMESIKTGLVKKFTSLTNVFSIIYKDEDTSNAHNAYFDVLYCIKIYKYLIKNSINEL